jgi:hypothetical protein
MGLLSPWFLGGLAAAGLPLYLHLLRRHAATPRPFSSLRFFEQRTQSSIRHRRLRYLLLLSLRLALLALLALAFANPFISRATSAADTLALLVVDHAVSMRAGTRLADAKREASSVLASLGGSRRVQVATLGSELHLLTQPSQDAAAGLAAIAGIEPSDSRGSFGELAHAVRLMSEASPAAIELHLFSDMQRAKMPSNFGDAVLPPNATLVLHPVDEGALPNWAVESVAAPGQVWGSPRTGKTARVQAVVAGFGTPAATRRVSLAVNGRTTATVDVQVPPSGRTTVEFPSLDVPYGFSRCEVRIDAADPFAADDVYRFAVERADAPRTLFIHAAADARSPLYFESAIASAAQSAFVVESIPPDRTPAMPLSRYAFIVVSDALLPASLDSDLVAYVRSGGGLLVATGPSVGGRPRVPVLGAAILRRDGGAREAPARERILTVAETDPSHPALEGTGAWSGARFFYAVRVDAEGARVVARLSDQTPLVLDKKIGEGRVLLFASGLENVTNDFPLDPAFVPFVEKSAQYLSGAERRGGSRAVDSFLELRTAKGPEAAAGPGIEVVDPGGRRPLSLGDAATAQSIRLTDAGFYQIRLANGRQDLVAVNPDRRASNFDVIPAEAQALWRGTGREDRAPAGTAAPSAAPRKPFGLWWYVMIGGFALALIESSLASRYLTIQPSES